MKSKSGDEGGSIQTSSWPYFTLLDFMKDEVNTIPMSGNLEKSTGCSKVKVIMETVNTDENDIDSPDFQNSNQRPPEIDDSDALLDEQQDTLPTTKVSRKRKETVQDTVAKKMLLLEEKKIDLLKNTNRQHDDDSEDYHFLMSLLPHLQSLDPLRKLKVRNKLTQVIIDETSERPPSGRSTSTSLTTFDYNNSWSPQYDHQQAYGLHNVIE